MESHQSATRRASWNHAARQTEIFGHYYVGTPHFLPRLMEEPEGIAVKVLFGLEVEPPEVRRKSWRRSVVGSYREREAWRVA